MPFGIGWPEICLVLVVGLVLFGNKLPQLARWLGKSIVEFKKGVTEVQEDLAQIK